MCNMQLFSNIYFLIGFFFGAGGGGGGGEGNLGNYLLGSGRGHHKLHVHCHPFKSYLLELSLRHIKSVTEKMKIP